MGEEMLWGVKNGDLPTVKKCVENQFTVGEFFLTKDRSSNMATLPLRVFAVGLLTIAICDGRVVLRGYSKHVDVNTELMNGRLALHWAADYGQTEVIEYLISKGAKVNLADKHGITPLLAAVWEGHLEAVGLLIRMGADKGVKTPDGQKLLEIAETPEMKALLG